MSDPVQPSGSSKKARWLQWAHREIANKQRLGEVSGHRVSNTTHGKLMVPSRNGASDGLRPEMFVIAEPDATRPVVIEDDYIICWEYDPVNGFVGTEDILIAKPDKLRHSITGETKIGEDYTYTYAADPGDSSTYPQNKIRTSTKVSDGTTEDQRVIEPWIPSSTDLITSDFVPGDILFAIETVGTGVVVSGEELTLLDMTARQWGTIG